MSNMRAIAPLFLAILRGGGCVPPAKPPVPEVESSATDTPSFGAHERAKLTLRGLTFTLLAPTWKIERSDGQSATVLATDGGAYAARLFISATPGSRESWRDAKELSSENGVRISSISCEAGHGLNCYGLEIASGAYVITTSGVNFRHDDVLTMLRTAKAAK